MNVPELRVLFVCTGNICRSAFAELLTRRLLDDALAPADAARIAVASAGTDAWRGGGADPSTRAELARWRVAEEAVAAHVARQVEPAMLAEADLVLTAERPHRAHVVRLYPRGLRTAFCLREFHRLMPAADRIEPAGPVERLRAAVAEAATRRGTIPPVPPDADAVPDPYGRSPAVHRDCADLIGPLLADIVGTVAGGAVGTPPRDNTAPARDGTGAARGRRVGWVRTGRS